MMVQKNQDSYEMNELAEYQDDCDNYFEFN
jgi:hypothetical protein